MRIKGRRGGRMLAATSVAVGIGVLAMGTLAGAAPGPITGLAGSGVSHADQRTASGGGNGRGHLPKLTGTDQATYVDGSNFVKKQKVLITLPRTLYRVYADQKLHVTKKFLRSKSPIWPVTHKGKHPHFGVFPVATARALAFGAVPITAKLHLTQPVKKNGVLSPVVVSVNTESAPPFKTFPTKFQGHVIARISNVRVDEVPLHVGPDCHTATPLDLDLRGYAPAYNLFTGGPISGKVYIPRFVDCGTATNPLDRLLTGMISGPGNELHLSQGNLATFDTDKPSDCKGCMPPPK